MSSAVSPITSTPQPNTQHLRTQHPPRLRARFAGHMGDLTDRQIDAYQKAILQSFPELKKKYGNGIDMKGGYRLLSFELRNFINQTARQVTPEKIEEYSRQNRFGILEECVDAVYELWQLRVVQNNWITPQQSEHWGGILKTYRAEGRPFQDFMKHIQEELPQETLDAFQEMTRLTRDGAKELLSLIAGKYAIFSAEQPDFDMKAHTQPLLMDEIKELFENRKGRSFDEVALSTLGWLYTNIKMLPPGLFDKVMVNYMRHRLDLPIHDQDVTRLSRIKIGNRQYMHYNSPSDGDFKQAYNQRKMLYKGFEVLTEAGMLNQAERSATKKKLEVLG